MDSVFEEKRPPFLQMFDVMVSILVSVDSVFEVPLGIIRAALSRCFNPSFCGFGI